MGDRLVSTRLLVRVAAASLAWFVLGGQHMVSAHDRPAGPVHKTRSTVMARQGMAATSQPLATATAIRVLQQGGNAIDAAIAANAVLGVVEPMSCGLGGDLFAIVWDAKTKKLYGINASGRAPAAATIELFRSKNLAAIPTHGPLSWSVPGCVDGWDQLRQRFGTKAWPELLEPAIGYAENGFPVSEIIAAAWQQGRPRAQCDPDERRVFSARRLMRPRRARSSAIRSSLVRSERSLATAATPSIAGRSPTRSCTTPSRPAACSRSATSSSTRARLSIRVSTNYRGYDVWELPPNGQGIAVLQMLNLLEPFDLKKLGPQSAEALHLMIEAKKLAYEDRAKFYADPDLRACAGSQFDLQDVRGAASFPDQSRPGQTRTPAPANRPRPIPST